MDGRWVGGGPALRPEASASDSAANRLDSVPSPRGRAPATVNNDCDPVFCRVHCSVAEGTSGPGSRLATTGMSSSKTLTSSGTAPSVSPSAVGGDKVVVLTTTRTVRMADRIRRAASSCWLAAGPAGSLDGMVSSARMRAHLSSQAAGHGHGDAGAARRLNLWMRIAFDSRVVTYVLQPTNTDTTLKPTVTPGSPRNASPHFDCGYMAAIRLSFPQSFKGCKDIPDRAKRLEHFTWNAYHLEEVLASGSTPHRWTRVRLNWHCFIPGRERKRLPHRRRIRRQGARGCPRNV